MRDEHQDINTQSLLKLTPLSTTKLTGDICTIHPYTSKKQIQIIISHLENINYKGFVIIPDFSSKKPTFKKPRRKISYAPLTKKFFNTHESVYNYNIKMNVLKF